MTLLLYILERSLGQLSAGEYEGGLDKRQDEIVQETVEVTEGKS